MRIVGGEAKGRRLKHPKTMGTRPVIDRVKTALFDILGEDVEGARFLDLFAGTGSVGLEALSRGAKHATFIEISHQVAAVLRENLRITALSERADVIRGDAFRFLEQPATPERQYEIVYIAPPQYQHLAAKALASLDATSVLAPDGLAIVQMFPKERVDLDQLALQRLRQVDERRYGSTLLLFYREGQSQDSAQEDDALVLERAREEVSMSKPGGRFAFLDDSEVVRRLGIDRKTLEQFVKEGRLRTYGGVGKGAFFKTNEVEALYAVLHPEVLEEPAEETPPAETKPAKPGHDPAMRVHLRLQADLKWFDIREEDMAVWMRELNPEAYQRQRSTILQVIGKLQHIVDLIDANSAPREPS